MRSAAEHRNSQWLAAIAVALAIFASLVAIGTMQFGNQPMQITENDWQTLEQVEHDTGGTPLITRLTVVSVNRSEPLMNLVDWSVLDLSELPPIKVLIQATRNTVMSVEVRLDGTLLAIRDEFPMFITDMTSLNLPSGIHRISVTPFSQRNGSGIRGPERQVSFIVISERNMSSIQGLAIFPDTLSSMMLSANGSAQTQSTEVAIAQPYPNIPVRISAIPRPGLRFQAFIDSVAVTPSINDFPFDFLLERIPLGLHSIVVVPNLKQPGDIPEHFTFFLNVVKSPFYPDQNLYPEVTDFILYNADLSEDINDFLIVDEFVINSADVIKHILNPTIRVKTSPKNVGSVRFQLDGVTIAISNKYPYRIGDTKFDLAPGTYNLSATAFSKQDAQGSSGPSRCVTLSFQ